MKIKHDLHFSVCVNYKKIVDEFKSICLTVVQDFRKEILDKVDIIILTNQYVKKCVEYGGDPNLSAGGCTLPTQNGFVIIINYEQCNCSSIGDIGLSYIANHFIYHELTHVENSILKEKDAKAYINSTNGNKFFSWLMYNEYLAEFNAQSKCPIEWQSNKYSSETFVKKINKNLENIHKKLLVVEGNNVNAYQNEIKAIANDMAMFAKTVCYDISLMTAQNMADNARCCNLKLSGLNQKVDVLINDFFETIDYETEDSLLLCMIDFSQKIDRIYEEGFFDFSKRGIIINKF